MCTRRNDSATSNVPKDPIGSCAESQLAQWRRVEISQASLEAIRNHAEKAYPAECCGFLLGARTDTQVSVVRAEPAENRCAESSRSAFTIAAYDYLEAERRAEEAGVTIVGFYHSHPDGAAQPSVTDLACAWPNTAYLIVGMDGPESAEMAGFVLDENRSSFRHILLSEIPYA